MGQIHVGAELAAGLERRFVLVAQQGGALDGTLVEVHADVNFPPPEDLPIDNELHAVVVAFAEVEAGGGAVAVVERIVGFPPSIVIHIGGIPHEPVAGDHVVGLAVVERGEDVHLVDAEVVGELESVGVLGVKVGVAEAYLVALADIHVGVEVPEMGAVYTAAVADLHTLHVGELVGEVQRRIELPIGLVNGFGGRVVEVFAVDGGVFGTQTGLQRKLFREVATQSAIDAVDMLAIVEVRRRGGVIDMRGGAGGAVVVSTLVGPVHATLVAGLQTPAVVEGAQPVELDIQRLVTVLRLAFAQIVVVIVGGGIAVDLLLLAVACHLAGAEGGVDGQLLILAVKLLCVEEVERMVEIDVVAAGGLVVVERVICILTDIGSIDVAVALTVAATQLVGEQQAVVVVEIVLAADFEAPHVVRVEAVLVDVVVRPSGTVCIKIFDIGIGVVAALAHTAVGIEEKVVLLGGVVEADIGHGSGNPARKRVGHHEGNRGTDVGVHHTVKPQGAGGLVLEFDIDDAAHALGVILRRGIGDDLDVLHR